MAVMEALVPVMVLAAAEAAVMVLMEAMVVAATLTLAAEEAVVMALMAMAEMADLILTAAEVAGDIMAPAA